MPKCKICDNNCESDYCFQHKPRKALSKVTKRLNTRQENKREINKRTDELLKRQEFFLSIWSKRIHHSEISGDFLGTEPLSTFFHHILPKSKYPEGAYDEENIILLTLEEHDNVENDMYKYHIVNEKRSYLMEKYGFV